MKKILVLLLVISIMVLISACGIPDLPGPLGIPGL